MEKLFLVVSFVCIAAAVAIGTSGCAVPVDVSVGLDLEDRCLLLLPYCSPDGGYTCADAEGREDDSCIVSCVAGRELVCNAETGPWCEQYIGSRKEFVPVVCVSRAE